MKLALTSCSSSTSSGGSCSREVETSKPAAKSGVEGNRADLMGQKKKPPSARGEKAEMREQLPPLLVELEQLVNASFNPLPAPCEALADKVRFLTNQFDVEHRRIIEVQRPAARRKARTLPGG